MEAIREGTYIPKNETVAVKPDRPHVNAPNMMKRHRNDVEFHHPQHKNSTKNHTIDQRVDSAEITDPKTLKRILESLNQKTAKKERNNTSNSVKVKKQEDDGDNNPHMHRESTIAKGETGNVHFLNASSNNSEEVLSEVLDKIQQLGADRGNVVLDKLNKRLRNEDVMEIRDRLEDEDELLDVKGRHYAKPPVNYNDNIDKARRRKRELILSTAMAARLTQNDEENDAAVEEVS